MSNVKIIAEIGVNHNGSIKLAAEMIEAASKCGADIVKFQTYETDKLVRKDLSKAEYQRRIVILLKISTQC